MEAVDSEGYELDVFLQKCRNKRSTIRFLTRLLGDYPTPKVIVTDRLKSYVKPIRRNLFAVAASKYTNKAVEQQCVFVEAKSIWEDAGHLCLEFRSKIGIYGQRNLT